MSVWRVFGISRWASSRLVRAVSRYLLKRRDCEKNDKMPPKRAVKNQVAPEVTIKENGETPPKKTKRTKELPAEPRRLRSQFKEAVVNYVEDKEGNDNEKETKPAKKPGKRGRKKTVVQPEIDEEADVENKEPETQEEEEEDKVSEKLEDESDEPDMPMDEPKEPVKPKKQTRAKKQEKEKVSKPKKEKKKTEEKHDEEEEEEAIPPPQEKPAKKGKAKAKATKMPAAAESIEETVEDAESKADREATPPADMPITITNCSKNNALGKPANFKIMAWNVGGLRAVTKKNGLDYIKQEDADIVCLQEVRCKDSDLTDDLKSFEGYHTYYLDSKSKKGYAGCAIWSKKEPESITYGINDSVQDEEGRAITAEFKDFYVVCTYVPNAGRKLVTLPKRLEWNEVFLKYIKQLDKKKPVIIAGDMNVSHKEIDLARPKSNQKNAGFTQEERDGMTDFLAEGYVDTFRHFYPDETDKYTFWSYMSNARAKNIGWRLDYFLASERFVEKICDNIIRSSVLGSDHCPIVLFLNA